MRHSEPAVRQWAANMIKSPYWEDVKDYVRAQLTDELIEAAHVGDVNAIKIHSFNLSTLDLVVQALGALSVDTTATREFYETVMDDGE